ncbi:MAG TPA: M1 family metallopeptidase [Roseiflexaceae bacterium]|nr:M1 family metallopeptidase [Roseiflexaceae bacterium]
MRQFFACILLVVLLGSAVLPASAQTAAQPPQAPRIASYVMNVRLDPAAKTVSGTEQITYQNPSQDTLHELWLRLYLKAFSSRDTIWMRESGGQLRGDQMDPNALGDITVSKLALADGTNLLASATMTDTLLRVPLPQPLGPGQSIEMNAEWISKLPRVFARTGYGGRDNTFFMVGQWYPKMTVYDRGHWDTEPWHANSEFFNDFGSYDVSITVPQQYVVAGAGVPAGERANSDGTKTLRFTSDNVTDFAFAASPDFRTSTAKAGAVDVVLYYLPEHAAAVDEYTAVSTGSLEAYSAWYGAYPHPRLTVVDVPDDASGAGGMEYPTLVTGGTQGAPIASGLVGMVTSHEIGHQWWPMQTATNEGREPWLDEGITEYSGSRYMVEAGRTIGFGSASISAAQLDRTQYAAAPNEPATLPSWKYSGTAYSADVYGKTAVALWTLENIVGTQRFRQAMSNYLTQYRFKHPTGADFRASLKQSLGSDADWFFDYMDGSGEIDYAVGGIVDNGSGVIIHRLGEAIVPVEVRVTRASGKQEIRRWDGALTNVRYDFGGSDPVVRVAVDPDHKLVAELDVLNNQASTQFQTAPTITLGGRLAFWFQVIAQAVGLFG